MMVDNLRHHGSTGLGSCSCLCCVALWVPFLICRLVSVTCEAWFKLDGGSCRSHLLCPEEIELSDAELRSCLVTTALCYFPGPAKNGGERRPRRGS